MKIKLGVTCAVCGKDREHHRLASIRGRCDSPAGYGVYPGVGVRDRIEKIEQDIAKLSAERDALLLHAAAHQP